MDTRSLIIARASALLADSADGDISTRAVCEAAGVTQPVLYRLFGDKDGLLAAVADAAWESYLAGKRRVEASADPIADVRAGWDAHTAFALQNPHAYCLVFASPLGSRVAAAHEAMRLLTDVLRRVAASGRLVMAPDAAARIVMSANSGVALTLLLRPETLGHADASAEVREAVLRAILIEEDVDAGADRRSAAATMLTAALDEPGPGFSPAESALMREWLDRFRG
ncbi:TetR/AcrR family transcriptional regulator [Microbacterium sp. ZW T5_56]|uniref:TetR/AcrR family transcriptional regulator n=1 Tax=Microbacterium sp. ZW T5_56 TaxID=3378081 RepID=UPI003851CE90